VSLRQNGVGPPKTCANAILPKGHRHLGFAQITKVVYGVPLGAEID